ncbi:MAG: translation elongation factor Ts [Kiloniellales bacterium]
MAEVTAALVRQLRERTGAGMMDCKKALGETSADLEAAVDWLREKGLAAAKRAGRVTAEGLVGVATGDRIGALVEVNSETDFVARNAAFQEFVRHLAELALDHHGDVEAIEAAEYPGTGRRVAQETAHMVATIGENINLRRAAAVEVDPGVVASYTHGQIAPGLGSIGVLVGLQSTGDRDRLMTLGKQLAMHVAWAVPQVLGIEDIDDETLARERAVLTAQARASGRPDDIVQKMVEGRLRKFYEQVVLLEQTFVMDQQSKVSQVLAAAAKDLGAAVTVGGFRCFILGEGIAKEQTEFAAEVAAQLGR